MGLNNIVWHEHHWPGGDLPDEDQEDEVFGRHDACEDEQGRFFVWRADTDRIILYCTSREEASEYAREFAKRA